MMNAFTAQSSPDYGDSPRQFSLALKQLMEERGLSYRQLAYKTKLSAGYLNHLTKGTRPTPADAIIEVIAAALYVKPEYFFEYRLRRVFEVLERSSDTADQLYEALVVQRVHSSKSSVALKGIPTR